jgi:hypothetical protein
VRVDGADKLPGVNVPCLDEVIIRHGEEFASLGCNSRSLDGGMARALQHNLLLHRHLLSSAFSPMAIPLLLSPTVGPAKKKYEMQKKAKALFGFSRFSAHRSLA